MNKVLSIFVIATIGTFCLAQTNDHLFSWESWFKEVGEGGIQHHAYMISARLLDGITKEDAIKEIVRCLNQNSPSDQKLAHGLRRAGFRDAGVRDSDALAIALGQLTGIPFEIAYFEDSQTRDQKILQLLEAVTRKQNRQKKLRLTGMTFFACLLLATGTWGLRCLMRERV